MLVQRLSRSRAMAIFFNMVVRFEDQVYIHNNRTTREVEGLTLALEDDLKIAVNRIITVFCEAMRLRSIYLLAHTDLGGHEYATPLTVRLWNLLRSWGKLSDYMLRMRR